MQQFQAIADKIGNHQNFVSRGERGLENLDAEQKSVLISYLRLYLEHNSPDDAQEADLKQDFPREYALLLRAANSLQFSDAYNKLQRRETTKLMDVFNHPEVRRLSSRWHKVPTADRKDFLKECQKIHANLQSKGPVHVDPVKVRWFNYDSDSNAGVLMVPKQNPETYFITVERERAVLNNLTVALRTISHEQRHIMQMVLANAHYKGTLPAKSPYAADAEMLFHIFNNGAGLPVRFGEAYRTMPHERDARILNDAVESLRLPFPPAENNARLAIAGLAIGIAATLLLAPRPQLVR